jgi:hypothetical protein
MSAFGPKLVDPRRQKPFCYKAFGSAFFTRK